uniref:Uncharacterized protein n=1 Tax=Calidris pygmaea TaxID=425635 RepID=A0A8C3JGE6_9CHAR
MNLPQRCCGDKHTSSCQGNSVPTISSEGLPGDKGSLHCVPLNGHILLRDRAGLSQGRGH